MAIKKSDEWINFIRLYKNLPELWNVKHEHYKCKNIRVAAYERLRAEYQNIDENSTVETVKNRIRNMRIAYKRELRKKLTSERNRGVEFMYEPNLWYFSELDFLKDLELPEDELTIKPSSDDECSSPIPTQSIKRKRASERNELRRIAAMYSENFNKKKRNETDKAAYNERSELLQKAQMHKESAFRKARNESKMNAYNERNERRHSSSSTVVQKENVYQKEHGETETKAFNERNELLRKATMYMENLSKKERDEADIYAEDWAHSYRKLSETQRLYAKKACDDIFILAQLGKLHFNTVNTNETLTYQTTVNARYSSDGSLDEMN